MLEERKAAVEAGQQRERVARMKEEAVARVAKKKEAAKKAEREALAEEDLGIAALEAVMEARESSRGAFWWVIYFISASSC